MSKRTYLISISHFNYYVDPKKIHSHNNLIFYVRKWKSAHIQSSTTKHRLFSAVVSISALSYASMDMSIRISITEIFACPNLLLCS